MYVYKSNEKNENFRFFLEIFFFIFSFDLNAIVYQNILKHIFTIN